MSAERIILKQSGLSRAVPMIVWTFCVLACVDAVVEGTVGYTVRTILVVSAVSIATWIVLFSPSLAVDVEGLTILNPVRVVRVPFGALIEVKVGGAVSIVARYAGARERKVTSWNAPGVPRRQPTRRAALATFGPTTSEVASAVDRFQTPWERDHPHGDSAATATIAWRWREWSVLALLILVNVAIRLR